MREVEVNLKNNMLAAISLLGLGTAASAQSNVTLFGIVDVAARHVRNQGAQNVSSVISGGASSGRLGFRRTEDLGEGWSTTFWIESTVAADTGAGGGTGAQFWDRRATLALQNRQWGEIRLGRDFVPTFDTWSDFDPFGNNGVATAGQFAGAGARTVLDAFGASSNPRTDVRANNTVQYILPSTLGGVFGALMAAPSEGTPTASGGGRLQGGRLGWRSGALRVQGAYLKTRTDRAGHPWIEDSVLGASYAFDPVTLGVAWRRFDYLTSSQRNVLLSASVKVGAGVVKAIYLRGDAKGEVGATPANIDANDGRKIGLGYVHALSKRSALYAHVARVSNRGTATNAISGGSTAGQVPGGTSTAAEFGIKHSF